MRILISVSLIFFLYQKGFSQIGFKNIESKTTQNAFIQFRDFLLRYPTDTIHVDGKTGNPERWSFYDSVINKFFDRSKMINEFRNNKDSYDFSSLMAIQYQILHSIDKFIDHIPDDSIFVMKSSEYYKSKNLENSIDLNQVKNRFLAGFIINNENYPVLDIGFDAKSNSFIMMMPMIYFDKKEGKVVGNFLERHRSIVL